MTNQGIPDKDFQIKQTITEDMLYINENLKKFQVSVDLTATGCVQNNIAVYDSSSKAVVSGNRAVLGDMITFNYISGKISDATIKFKINDSYVKDTDGDGILDLADERPLKYDVTSILLFRSAKQKEKDQYGKMPLDLTHGDFDRKEIVKLNSKMQKTLSDGELLQKTNFISLIGALSFPLSETSAGIVSHFFGGTGTDYSSSGLTKVFKEHENTKKFVKETKDKFTELLKIYSCDLGKLKFTKDGQYDSFLQDNISYPKFTTFSDNFNGMGILIHDIWSCHIQITDYKFVKNKYSGKMKFTFYDHFGLNNTDITKGFGYLKGFRSWFILQHYSKYNSKYKPFVTVVTFEIPFEGVCEK